MLGNRIYYWFWPQDQMKAVDFVLFSLAHCELKLIDPKYIPSNVWCQCQHSIDISRNSIGNVTFHFFVFPVKKSISDGSRLPLLYIDSYFRAQTTFNQQWARLYCRYIWLGPSLFSIVSMVTAELQTEWVHHHYGLNNGSIFMSTKSGRILLCVNAPVF